MPHMLRSLRIGKVDFVDRPADPHARMAIWKRDTSNPPSGEAPDADDPKEGTVPEIPTLTDEVRKGLPEEAVDVIDALTAALNEARTGEGDAAADTDGAAADADADKTDDLAKRDDLPEDVRAAIAKRDAEIEALRKSAEAADQKVEAEIAKRETREWADRLAKFDGALPEDAPEKFRALAKSDADLAEDMVKALDALREQVDTAALFKAAGHDQPADGSAEATLNKRVSEIAKSDGIDAVEAEAKFLDTPEGQKVYEQYLAEKGA